MNLCLLIGLMIYSSHKVFKNRLLLVTIMRITREGVIFLGARVSSICMFYGVMVGSHPQNHIHSILNCWSRKTTFRPKKWSYSNIFFILGLASIHFVQYTILLRFDCIEYIYSWIGHMDTLPKPDVSYSTRIARYPPPSQASWCQPIIHKLIWDYY